MGTGVESLYTYQEEAQMIINYIEGALARAKYEIIEFAES